jgi:hypothetical protein
MPPWEPSGAPGKPARGLPGSPPEAPGPGYKQVTGTALPSAPAPLARLYVY